MYQVKFSFPFYPNILRKDSQCHHQDAILLGASIIVLEWTTPFPIGSYVSFGLFPRNGNDSLYSTDFIECLISTAWGRGYRFIPVYKWKNWSLESWVITVVTMEQVTGQSNPDFQLQIQDLFRFHQSFPSRFMVLAIGFYHIVALWSSC